MRGYTDRYTLSTVFSTVIDRIRDSKLRRGAYQPRRNQKAAPEGFIAREGLHHPLDFTGRVGDRLETLV